MVYIFDKNILNDIRIPRNYPNLSLNTHKLELHSDMTNQNYEFTGLYDYSSDVEGYYDFRNIDFSMMVDGEYSYSIDDGRDLGLMKIGKKKPIQIIENKEENNVVEYNPYE